MPPKSQSITPWYLDKAVYMTLIGLILPLVSAKLGVQLDAAKLASAVVLVVTFVVSHKVKSGKVLMKEIEIYGLQQLRNIAQQQFGVGQQTNLLGGEVKNVQLAAPNANQVTPAMQK